MAGWLLAGSGGGGQVAKANKQSTQMAIANQDNLQPATAHLFSPPQAALTTTALNHIQAKTLPNMTTLKSVSCELLWLGEEVVHVGQRGQCCLGLVDGLFCVVTPFEEGLRHTTWL